MNNRFNLFAFLICSALMVLPFWGLAAEKDLPPEAEIQELAPDKHKYRRSQPEEPEAQAMPLARKLEDWKEE